MKPPTCPTCPYLDAFEADSIIPHDFVGMCRRRSPGPVPTIDSASLCSPEQVAWPLVEGDDWCGEHPDFPAYLAGREPKPHEPEPPQCRS